MLDILIIHKAPQTISKGKAFRQGIPCKFIDARSTFRDVCFQKSRYIILKNI